MELVPCFCCLAILVAIGGVLAWLPIFVRKKNPPRTKTPPDPAAREPNAPPPGAPEPRQPPPPQIPFDPRQ